MRTALVEFVTSKLTLHESEGSAPVLEGVAGRVGVKNRNGRVYPVEVMRRAVDAVQGLISEGEFTGELDHPEYNPHGSLKDTAFRFTSLYMEGDLVKFKASVLETSAGQNLLQLLRGGVKVGMSTRGIGNVSYEEINDEEVMVVDNDYELFGVDAVKMPSSVEGVMKLRESLEEALSERINVSKPELTLAALRESHAELVAQIKADALAEAKVADKDARITALEADVARLTGERDAAAEKFESVKKSVLGEQATPNADETSVSLKIDQLLESNQTLQARLDEREEADRERAAQVKLDGELKEAFETALKDSPHAEKLRKSVDPLKFESVEKLSEQVAFYNTLLEGTAPKSPTPRGGGIVEGAETPEDADDTEPLDEATKRQYRLAGLSING